MSQSVMPFSDPMKMPRKDFRFRNHLSVTVLCLAGFVLVGCATGRRALDSGNYEKATRLSANHLSNYKNSANARDVLVAAYPQARALYLAKANAAERASYLFHWEDVVAALVKLEKLADSIEQSEGANHLELDVLRVAERLVFSKRQAALDRELAGDESLGLEGRYNARVAYEHYEKAIGFNPENSTLDAKLAGALDAATIRLALNLNVEGVSPIYSRELLEDIEWEIRGRQLGKFVQWIPYGSAYADSDTRKADHILSLSIGQWDIGRQRRHDSIKTYQREIEIDGENKKTEKVSAKVKTIRIDKESHGSLFLTVYDYELNQVVLSTPVTDRIHWREEYYQVSGDERALNNPKRFRARRPPKPPSDYWQEKELIDSLAQKTKRSLRLLYRSFY